MLINTAQKLDDLTEARQRLVASYPPGEGITDQHRVLLTKLIALGWAPEHVVDYIRKAGARLH